MYEMEIQGVACMRRRSDGWLNATQILKVAGVDKGKRTKVLEKEILTGEHEKVQGGYGKYQGTWISYRRGREFCRAYGVEDILRPLLDYDVTADGSGGQGQETPTKEQAMAANRKRFYQPTVEQRPQGPVSNGTFFSNISSTTSVALAAMNKAARLNSPAPRPPSSQQAPHMRQLSQQDGIGASQQSMVSQGSIEDSGYSTQPQGSEPPRKRLRYDEAQDGGMLPPAIPIDISMRSATPTEPNESFMYDGAASQEYPGEAVAQPPLPAPSTDEQLEKRNLILDLFADAGNRTDYSTHDALTKLSGEDLNLPLDQTANNALHWAATLAKIPLLKLLIQRGANIWRGNAVGQTPLISAILVGNCWENTCFPELLELFGPLIEVRDAQGRTILHHIAVSSGIKGRAPSSKYYLEALLEYLVRIGTSSSAAPSVAAAVRDVSTQDSAASNQKGAVSLVKFLSHVVNARDKAGNTALNLVARIGNRSIIQQLLEIHADPTLPNFKGVSAKDFGVSGGEVDTNGASASQQSFAAQRPASSTQDTAMTIDGDGPPGDSANNANEVDDLSQDIVESITSLLTANLATHKEILRLRTAQIDRLNEQIREFSAMQKADLENLQALKDRVKARDERRAKIANLRRVIEEYKSKPEQLPRNGERSLDEDSDLDPGRLPDAKVLRGKVRAYEKHTARLTAQAEELQSRSSEVEGLYRRVVSLCTGVEESKVEACLEGLVQAVESETRGGSGGGGGDQEVGRVREFLRRVDGTGGMVEG